MTIVYLLRDDDEREEYEEVKEIAWSCVGAQLSCGQYDDEYDSNAS